MALLLLSGLVVVFFLCVTGLSRLYYAQQESLAIRWSTRGAADLSAHRFDDAAAEFNTALRYSRDNFFYQLSLAEALIGLHRTGEAYAYLINLWEQQPENGQVNLELARIAAAQDVTPQAIRYYHNAIYANWPGDQETQERDARLELIQYLLRIKAKAEAQSELISLAAYLGGDPKQQDHLGSLFLQTQDYGQALAAYRRSLSQEPHDQTAFIGAGNSAFALGEYQLAQRYLQEALEIAPLDPNTLGHLKLAGLVLKMDPLRSQIRVAQRNKAVLEDFDQAGLALKSCPVAASYVSSTNPQHDLAAEWASMKPQMTAGGLLRNPDLVTTGMQTVFNIERQAVVWCGAQSDADSALLLIAKLHEGS